MSNSGYSRSRRSRQKLVAQLRFHGLDQSFMRKTHCRYKDLPTSSSDRYLMHFSCNHKISGKD